MYTHEWNYDFSLRMHLLLRIGDKPAQSFFPVKLCILVYLCVRSVCGGYKRCMCEGYKHALWAADSSVLREVEAYDPRDDVWVQTTSLPQGSINATACVLMEVPRAAHFTLHG